MALKLGAATSDGVRILAHPSINDFSAFTVIYWHRPTTQSANRRHWAKGSKDMRWRFGDVNEVEFSVERATTQGIFVTAENFTTDKWWCFVGTYDETAGPLIYFGDRTQSIGLAADFGSNNTGAGTTNVDNASNLLAGNGSSEGASIQGDLSFFGYWNRVLPINEIEDQRRKLHVSRGSRVFTHIGFGHPQKQIDWSGHGNHGIVTGAKPAPQAPLPIPVMSDPRRQSVVAVPPYRPVAAVLEDWVQR